MASREVLPHRQAARLESVLQTRCRRCCAAIRFDRQRQEGRMRDAGRIKALLRERVAELAQYLFPNGHREGLHWCVGSIEGEPGKSFKICIAGEKTGLWGDFADSGKHSRSLLDLWMRARNVDFTTALREAAEWLGEPLNRSSSAARLASTKRTLPLTFSTFLEAISYTARKLKK